MLISRVAADQHKATLFFLPVPDRGWGLKLYQALRVGVKMPQRKEEKKGVW